jgi:hypothetical protein
MGGNSKMNQAGNGEAKKRRMSIRTKKAPNMRPKNFVKVQNRFGNDAFR